MTRNENVKNFLIQHRSRVNAEDYGFSNRHRRVPGLRREEVAQASAGILGWNRAVISVFLLRHYSVSGRYSGLQPPSRIT